ncbi:hypothetical protein [Flagellimonas myxillae]|uniref:hypothetical protein n=1 Tax=Flagellimonas myxillae TaxID=2942214 RepID=UPI00201E857E|nr:hypothetical protein [Muricauda myxillae]MCL6265082.1 hypothetical protein [Muricauda myxillae]
MHQNLRTSFTLNDQTLMNLSKEERNKDGKLQKMQMLIPAQNYNTFFCLYAKFNGEITGGGDDVKFYPESCDLFLQNYYGDVTLGLVKLNQEVDIIYDAFIDQPIYLLKVHVRALHACVEFNQPQPIKVRKQPSILNYKDYADNTDWSSLMGGWINPNYLLRVLVYYDNLPTNIFDPKDSTNNNIFIDSYKYERDGDELYIKKFQRPDGTVFLPKGHNFGDFEIDEKNGEIITYKCRPAYVQFRL